MNLIFTEGTIIMHPAAKGLSREQRVFQSKTRTRTVADYQNYIPNGVAVTKIYRWKRQRAEIYYLTSRTEPMEVNHIRFVLRKYDFPDSQNLLFLKKKENDIKTWLKNSYLIF